MTHSLILMQIFLVSLDSAVKTCARQKAHGNKVISVQHILVYRLNMGMYEPTVF